MCPLENAVLSAKCPESHFASSVAFARPGRVGWMQAGEAATLFVRRVFSACFEDQSPAALENVRHFFDHSYIHEADGQVLDLCSFEKVMRSQRARLTARPSIVWKSLVATAPSPDGRVHVTSVHTVQLELANRPCCQKVVALIEIDVTNGKIVHCEELTRMESDTITAPSVAVAAPSMENVPLTRPQLEELRAEAYADDLPIPPEAAGWTREDATAYFESGAATLPTGGDGGSSAASSVAISSSDAATPESSPPLMPSSHDVLASLSRSGTHEKELDRLPLIEEASVQDEQLELGSGSERNLLGGLAFRRCRSSPMPATAPLFRTQREWSRRSSLDSCGLEEALRRLPLVVGSS